MASILFVCLHNACRSRIAAAIARAASPPGWLIQSAGTAPSYATDPKASALIVARALPLDPDLPRGVADVDDRDWDAVVGMGCGDLRGLARARRHVEWIVADPHDGAPEVYEALFRELDGRVRRLIASLDGAAVTARPENKH